MARLSGAEAVPAPAAAERDVLFRRASGQVLATVICYLGDFDAAWQAFHDAAGWPRLSDGQPAALRPIRGLPADRGPA